MSLETAVETTKYTNNTKGEKPAEASQFTLCAADLSSARKKLLRLSQINSDAAGGRVLWRGATLREKNMCN
jgi:hypothetical protein